jgi:acetyl-CoA synthetase
MVFIMSNKNLYPVPQSLAENANIDKQTYDRLYERSLGDPDGFWGDVGQRITWIKPYTKVKNASFEGDVQIKWYEDGTLNACYNCLDRHLETKGDQIALIFEGDEPDTHMYVSFREAHTEVCKLANALKARGVQKGDRVTIYMPMILEATYAMLACARIGAVHSVVFGGFSPESLAQRIQDCESTVIMTANEGVRGGKIIPLKANVDKALASCSDVHTVFVYKRTDAHVNMIDDRDVDWQEFVSGQSNDCPCEEMNAEDPLFILYTSGSTGKPKGVLHTTGGYMVYASYTHDLSFDWKEGDVYWCTADVGWITGHSYIVYGPLANGATTLIFEGVPNYPTWSRFWDVVDKHKVNLFYTAPTAIRSLLKEGDDFVKRTDRSSLRLLGTVGEPINVEAWEWYYNVVGEQRCPIIDTWWQTETGGHLITPLAGVTDLKPGSASQPFLGIDPVIVDNDGNELSGECEGNLCIRQSWPGQMRTVYKNHDRFVQTYFSTFKGLYFTGDGVRRDADGYYWITGRVDDVINVSGHRFGTAEIESAIDEHESVAESAVVGFPHDIKGQGIYAYVILNTGAEETPNIKREITLLVREMIGAIATIDVIQIVPGLPKTRSGKIMRRILRKVAAGESDQLGDISTLADPSVVEHIVNGKIETKAA